MLLAFLEKASLKKRISFLFLYLFTLYAAIAIAQAQIDKTGTNINRAEDMKYLPSGQFLKGAALAYDELFADFLWIKAVIYFGDHFQGDKAYKWLYHLLDIVSTLDPNFQYPYEFGGVALAFWVKDMSLSNKILKKGMMNVPKTHERYWTIPFFLGFNYMFYKKDYATAARYLEVASRYNTRSRNLPLLVARLYTSANDHEIAIDFLKEMYFSVKNEEAKKDIEKRIKEVMVERDIKILERARDKFKEKTGSFPAQLKDLIAARFINNIPREPFGGEYFIMKDSSIQSSVIKKRMKVYIR